MFRKRLLYILMLMFSILHSHAQEYSWRLGLDYFFNNGEYDASNYVKSGTMNGIWLNPIGSVTWEERHSIQAGVNLLKIPGRGKALDKTDVTLFYQYERPNMLFRAGSFPRGEVLDNYNTFFFKDSVNHFIPLMQGIFWQAGNKENFVNLWLDWTGYATPGIHESFFAGISGKWSKNRLFADFQSYMFHHSMTSPAIEGEGVNENLQIQVSTGAQFTQDERLNGSVSIGVLAGYERDRRPDGIKYTPVGFTSRIEAEYLGIGTSNNIYVGQPRMRLSGIFGDNLYWGTQFLQGRYYVRSDWHIRLIESGRVKVKLNSNLHFSEGNVMFQQLFTVSAAIGNQAEKSKSKAIYPWARIFNR